jgi:3-hydroxyisobutyrate dehydrogenase-like beta-hydroxyacid dehydrogenase
MYDVITDGLFGGSNVYSRLGAAMIDGTSGGGLTVRRALQILDLVMAGADQVRVPLPSVDACRDRLLGTVARGEGEDDWTVLYREQARASGLE